MTYIYPIMIFVTVCILAYIYVAYINFKNHDIAIRTLNATSIMLLAIIWPVTLMILGVYGILSAMQRIMKCYYEVLGTPIVITKGPCCGSVAKIICVKKNLNEKWSHKYTAAITDNENGNVQITILNDDEFEVIE